MLRNCGRNFFLTERGVGLSLLEKSAASARTALILFLCQDYASSPIDMSLTLKLSLNCSRRNDLGNRRYVVRALSPGT